MRRLSNQGITAKTPHEYNIIYSLFTDQSTQLESLLSDIQLINDQNCPSISEMKNCIGKILSSHYGTVLEECKYTIMSMQNIISSEKDIMVTAIAQDILLTAVSIYQLTPEHTNNNGNKNDKKLSKGQGTQSQTIEFSPLISQAKCGVINYKLDNTRSFSFSASSLLEVKDSDDSFESSRLADSPEDDGDFVFCRICDEKVPLDLIDEHMKSCVKAYKNTSIVTKIHNQLKQIIGNAQHEYMNVKWPGPVRIATLTLIPLLKISLLIEKTLLIDVNLSDAQEELGQILAEMVKLKSDNSNPTIMQIIKSIRPLLKQKLRASKTIANAEVILRQTRMSGDGHASYHTQAQISDFDFIKRISSGAYARVFLARKKRTGDIFAIKVIPRSSLKQKNQVKRVLAEKDILLQFCNPYIVNFYYSIMGNHNLYLVMEFLPGGDLYSLLQKLGSLDEQATKFYLLQILHALKYLHSNGIIHRDLKPDNVLIAVDGKLKLTDFGLSYVGMVDRQKTQDVSLVTAKSLVGTPDYVAPEIILSATHTVSADYWSFGIMLYECLFGEPPFHGENEKQTYNNILSGRYIIDEDDELSPEAEDLIRKLLVTNPEERLGTKDINDIFNHPFFSGVDLNDEPPFKPCLKNEEDTGYFETRYQFNEKDEFDIMSDIAECQKDKNVPIPPLQPEATSEINETKIISNFESVSINSLAEVTRMVAAKRRRSLSFVESPRRQEMGQNSPPTPNTTINVPPLKKPLVATHTDSFVSPFSKQAHMTPRKSVAGLPFMPSKAMPISFLDSKKKTTIKPMKLISTNPSSSPSITPKLSSPNDQ